MDSVQCCMLIIIIVEIARMTIAWCINACMQTDRTDRTDMHTDTLQDRTDMHTYIQTDRQTDRQTDMHTDRR